MTESSTFRPNGFDDFDLEIDDLELVDSIDASSDTSAPDDLTPFAASETNIESSVTTVDSQNQSWNYRARVAANESEKEYLVFKFWLEAGSGRSKTYISKVYNYPESRILQIASKNNWDLRAAEYDRYQLQLMSQAENSRRAQEHKQKLEEYRQQQEFIGRSLSADAAKLAAIVSNTLDKFMLSDREIDIRDLPAVLNAANKAAEVGRNLQSSSLGVDQLLTALEEVDD